MCAGVALRSVDRALTSPIAAGAVDADKLRYHRPGCACMTLATILSRTQQGLDAPLVRVEVDSSGGLPQFSIVGLPEAVVKESKDRVRAAIAELRLRVPGRAHHRQPRARGPAEGGRPVRPADCRRHPRRQREAAAGGLRRHGAVRRALARRDDPRHPWCAADRAAGDARRPRADRADAQRGARPRSSATDGSFTRRGCSTSAAMRAASSRCRASSSRVTNPVARRSQTSPTFAVSRVPAVRSRSRRRAVTACC